MNFTLANQAPAHRLMSHGAVTIASVSRTISGAAFAIGQQEIGFVSPIRHLA
jgi:hypothetical protein